MLNQSVIGQILSLDMDILLVYSAFFRSISYGCKCSLTLLVQSLLCQSDTELFHHLGRLNGGVEQILLIANPTTDT